MNCYSGGGDEWGGEREKTKWEKVVEIVQLAFRDGIIPGCGPDTERGRGLTRHRPHGGDLGGGGGDSKSTLHLRRHLPQLPLQIPVGSRYGYHHPRDQSASAGCGLEGGGSPCNIPEPSEVSRRLGQVQVPEYPGLICRGAQGPLPPTKVLGEAEYGGACGRLLRSTLLRRERGHPD